MSGAAARPYWVAVKPPFGEAHEHGCCAAYVERSFMDGTVCGWPRNADGTCRAGHPAQPTDATTHSIADLRAASRVLATPPGQEAAS